MAYRKAKQRIGAIATILIGLWLLSLVAFMLKLIIKLWAKITGKAEATLATAGSTLDKSINVAAAAFVPASLVMAGILMQSVPVVGTGIGWALIIVGAVVAVYQLFDWYGNQPTVPEQPNNTPTIV